MSRRPIRVLVVDDSALVRKVVSRALSHDPEIEVVGTAIDPFMARDKIKDLNPDVLTLDLEMPRMDGLTFLRILMEQHPLPVIVMSSLTQRGSAYALEALRLGAFDVVEKPADFNALADIGSQLIPRIKATAGARLRKIPPSTLLKADPLTRAFAPRQIILLGASTGGTEALHEVLTQLPPGLPGIAIVQHIPATFSKSFAERLNKETTYDVREAVDGDKLGPGTVLIAPGNFHMLLQWRTDHYAVRIADGPAVWHQRPAIDVLFKSAADCGAAPHAFAGVLTGMGRDGAEGLLRLRTHGATTFAQDEASSVVYGMPRAAWENGAAQTQITLDRIAPSIVRHHESLPPAASQRTPSPS
ncbi:MAG: chemotaxis response regulator protein-glutamate methylesterase [Opitutaceae bacterium]